MTRTQLTPEDDMEIAARYRQGARIRQLAGQYGVSHPAILRALDRAQEPRRNIGYQKKYDVSDETILFMRDDRGLTWADMAAETGMTASGVRYRYDTAVRRASHAGGD